jgi:hypothetical protein
LEDQLFSDCRCTRAQWIFWGCALAGGLVFGSGIVFAFGLLTPPEWWGVVETAACVGGVGGMCVGHALYNLFFRPRDRDPYDNFDRSFHIPTSSLSDETATSSNSIDPLKEDVPPASSDSIKALKKLKKEADIYYTTSLAHSAALFGAKENQQDGSQQQTVSSSQEEQASLASTIKPNIS